MHFETGWSVFLTKYNPWSVYVWSGGVGVVEMGLGSRAELWGRTNNSCREHLSSNEIHSVPGLCMFYVFICPHWMQSFQEEEWPCVSWFSIAQKSMEWPAVTSLAAWTPSSWGQWFFPRRAVEAHGKCSLLFPITPKHSLCWLLSRTSSSQLLPQVRSFSAPNKLFSGCVFMTHL